MKRGLLFIVIMMLFFSSQRLFAENVETKSFKSFTHIVADPDYSGWHIQGRFGPDGPFILEDEIDFPAGQAANFVHETTTHMYPAMEGYQFKLLKLRTMQGEETSVVLKSNEPELVNPYAIDYSHVEN